MKGHGPHHELKIKMCHALLFPESGDSGKTARHKPDVQPHCIAQRKKRSKGNERNENESSNQKQKGRDMIEAFMACYIFDSHCRRRRAAMVSESTGV